MPDFSTLGRIGFIYDVSVLRDGVCIDREVLKNLIPVEGLNSLLSVYFAGAAALPSWFIGLFEGNYTPLSGDTGALFPGRATETTAYNEPTRVAWQHDPVASGTIANSTTKANFTLNAAKTLYGAFMVSTSAKNDVSGTLVSAARFASPKVVAAGDILQVISGLTLTSN